MAYPAGTASEERLKLSVDSRLMASGVGRAAPREPLPALPSTKPARRPTVCQMLCARPSRVASGDPAVSEAPGSSGSAA